MLQLVFVLGRHDDDVRDGPQVREVEEPVVGRAVVAHDAAAVQGEHHGELLEADVVQHLVVGPLHEGGVDGHHGDDPLRRPCPAAKVTPCCSAIPTSKNLSGNSFAIGVQSRPAAHGRRDGHDLRVFPGELDHRPAEDLRVAGDAARIRGMSPVRALKGPMPWNFVGSSSAKGYPLPFFVSTWTSTGRLCSLTLRSIVDEVVEAVPSRGPTYSKPSSSKRAPGVRKRLEGLLGLAGELDHLLADVGDAPEELLHVLPELGDPAARHDLVEVGRKGAHVGRNRHLVVVQDDDEVLLAVARPVEPFEGHARRHGPVADDGDDLEVFALEAARFRDPGRGRDRGAAVAHAEDVVDALLASREAADTAAFAQRVELVPPAGDEFVGVGLVTHIPDDLVPGGIEDVVEGKGELHGAKRGGQVAAVFGAGLDDDPADVLREDFKLLLAEQLDVGR